MTLPLPETVGWPGGPQFQTFGLFLLAGLLLGYALDRAERRDARWLAGLAGAWLVGRLLRQVVFPDLAWGDPRSWIRLTGDAFSYEGAVLGFLAGQAALAGGGWRQRLGSLDRLASPLAAATAVGMIAWPARGVPATFLALPDPAGRPALAVQVIGAVLYALVAWALGGRRQGAPGSLALFLASSGAIRFGLGWLVADRSAWWGELSAVQVGALASVVAATALAVAGARPAELFGNRLRLAMDGTLALLVLAAAVTILSWPAPGQPQAGAGGAGGGTGAIAQAPESGSSGSSGGELPAAAVPGYPAPDFTAKALDGSTFRLADLRGRPVLLNFWASWCPPCKEEMPDLEAFHKKYGDRIAVVGVDMQESPETVARFTRENGYDWRFVLDPGLDVAQLYRVGGIPTSFWIDAGGVVRVRFTGPMTLAQMEAYFKQVGEAGSR
ncbi:MAG: TlpA disulfide reductase family protein [Bacillota bacterium]|nr:TlpA disulfide reductase family protein [Bacillota bacterium]